MVEFAHTSVFHDLLKYFVCLFVYFHIPYIQISFKNLKDIHIVINISNTKQLLIIHVNYHSCCC